MTAKSINNINDGLPTDTVIFVAVSRTHARLRYRNKCTFPIANINAAINIINADIPTAVYRKVL